MTLEKEFADVCVFKLPCTDKCLQSKIKYCSEALLKRFLGDRVNFVDGKLYHA